MKESGLQSKQSSTEIEETTNEMDLIDLQQLTLYRSEMNNSIARELENTANKMVRQSIAKGASQYVFKISKF